MKFPKGPKQQQIIDAALQVFSQKGYHKTRMEEIAVTAGIGKGTIYEYFDSKIHLFQAMIEDGIEQYQSGFDPDELVELSFFECLRILINAHVHFCLKNKELTRVLFMDKEAPPQELWQWAIDKHKEKMERLQIIMDKAIERGEIRPLDAKLLSYVIGSSMESLCFPLVMEDWEASPDYITKQYIDFISKGVAF